jgi:hypothetical protein
MGTCRMAKGLKDPCRHVAGVGGQYKMYNSLIFINFISRSKNWNQKSKICIKPLFTVNKLLRLWYFVSVLNLKFLDQLERRHCKDTPYFRPFYIAAPKGPFLWGLKKPKNYDHRINWSKSNIKKHKFLITQSCNIETCSVFLFLFIYIPKVWKTDRQINRHGGR